ncbi:histone-fold-containing protein [Abortiporus biennis]|nr:histone-fold-containing protein [Abortiporus biennis]
MPRKDTSASAQSQQDAMAEGMEAYELPRSLVTRIARSACPDNVKLQKETVLALLKGSTVFINYIAATAHDVALAKQHKSIAASDVLKALELTQFGDMVDMLQNELQIHRDLQKHDKPKKSSGGAGGSSSAASKGKAKAKESETVFATKQKAPHVAADAENTLPTPESISHATSSGLHEEERAALEADERMLDGEPEPDEEDEEEDFDDGDEDVEEDVDTMALEEEEIRQDARGLDARVEDHPMEE